MHTPTFAASRDDYIAMIREWDTEKADQLAADPHATFTAVVLPVLPPTTHPRDARFVRSDVDATVIQWTAETPYRGRQAREATVIDFHHVGSDSVAVRRFIAPGALDGDQVMVLATLHYRETMPVDLGWGEL